MKSPPRARIGLDLDNTIIDYEALIREEVAALGLFAELPPGGKRALRDALRAVPEGETHWTRLQARVYGPRLVDAVPFAGALEFIRRATEAGYELVVVSHKTPVAAADEAGYDLHAAANRWLEGRGVVGPGGVASAGVFFESSRAAKVARIASLGLDAFIDDLAEVFAEPSFPAGVERWLFSPGSEHPVAGVDRVFTSWAAIEGHVFGPG